MNKLLKWGLPVAVVVIIIIILISSNYNTLVNKRENVEEKWAQVENVYQRRSDLIPNLVATVKGYAAHEAQTLEAVTNARAKATSIVIDPDNLDEATMKKFQQAQGELSAALDRLLAVTEAYPDLKANQNFLDLQSQLEGTENRITVERKRYAEAVKEYNVAIASFPTNIYAGWFGFEKKPQFRAEPKAEKAPEVQF